MVWFFSGQGCRLNRGAGVERNERSSGSLGKCNTAAMDYRLRCLGEVSASSTRLKDRERWQARGVKG